MRRNQRRYVESDLEGEKKTLYLGCGTILTDVSSCSKKKALSQSGRNLAKVVGVYTRLEGP